jgi:hypothetical protein
LEEGTPEYDAAIMEVMEEMLGSNGRNAGPGYHLGLTD